MEIKLQAEDSFRINGDYGNDNNFIDISRVGFSGIAATLFAGFQYIEIRRKDDLLRVYTFPRKSDKKHCDLGIWADSEVVFALNEQHMNKQIG